MKRDYAKTPPKNLTELNKESMLDFVEGKNDEEELIWFLDLLDSNRQAKEFRFDTKDGKHKKGDALNGYNMEVIRRKFAERYFDEILEKKSKKKPTGFEERVEELRRKLQKE